MTVWVNTSTNLFLYSTNNIEIKKPVVILNTGGTGTSRNNILDSIQFLQAGINVLIVNNVEARQNITDYDANDFHITAVTHTINDIHACFNYLTTNVLVDPLKIFMVGISNGSKYAGLYPVLNNSIRGSVLFGATCSGLAEWSLSVKNKQTRIQTADQLEKSKQKASKYFDYEYYRYLNWQRTTPILQVIGRLDSSALPAAQRRLFAIIGEPKVELPLGVTHNFETKTITEIVKWINTFS